MTAAKRAMRRTAVVVMVGWVALAMGATSASAQFGDLLRNKKKVTKISEAFTPWTEEQEQAIGEASAAKLIHVLGLYDNADMTRYVNLVGATLAKQGTRPMQYRFGILDTEAVTAFGMPGGYVFITRGALANMKNEAELAGTLAHEIAHVDNRHLEKEVRAKKVTGLGLEEVGDRVPAPSVLENVAKNLVSTALTSGYSRDKESEADRKGTQMAAASGYDAAGLKNFLSTLKTVADANPEASKRSLGLWNSTHPPLGERIANLTPIAAQFNGGEALEERFKKSASFGPTKEELAKAAAEKAAADKAAAEKAAAEKAAAKKKAAPGAKPKAKAAAPKKAE